ncbi:MAG: hypothetical protein PHQ12_11910 [Chthoniobacteraceae bacterium]|nr:hypothetical protein [Chthoniobacteraceae bacterium]
MTDAFLTSLFGGVTTLIVAINMIMVKRAEGRRKDAEELRLAAAEAARVLTESNRHIMRLKLQGVILTLAKIHSDGNGRLGIVMRLLAETQRKLAEKTQLQSDYELAFKLEARAESHEELQKQISEREAAARREFADLEKENPDNKC